MKNIVKFTLLLLMLFVLSGCGDDNSYDGKTGLNGGGSNSSGDSLAIDNSIKSIYALIKEDSFSAYMNSIILVQSVATLSDDNASSLASVQDDFKTLILSYKRVETLYVAGKNSSDMFDLASFYIEQFIKQSKGYDVEGDLEAVFAGTKSIVKNDLKGITALEYTLFGDAESLTDLKAKMNDKRVSSAKLMARNITKRLKEINDYYKNDTTFLNSNDGAISSILNVLKQEAFNLREWRVGEPAGFTLKFKDSPSSDRLEYHHSLYSLESIKEILKTNRAVMNAGLKSIAVEGNSASEADAILEAISDALAICDSYPSTIEDGLTLDKTKELYEVTRNLQNNYTALINGLNFKQDIVEADGD